MCRAVTKIMLVIMAVGMIPHITRAGPKEDARKHYDRAVELVDDNQLAEAVVEFQRAYDLTKHYSVLYNIGQVYVSLARPVEAIAAYEGYLASGGKNIPAARHQEVEKEISKQKTRIATLTIRAIPDGATIRVDGDVVGTSPLAEPLVLRIGDHVISASAENFEGAEVKVTLVGEDLREVELALKAREEKKVAVTQAMPQAPLAPPDTDMNVTETATPGLSMTATPGLSMTGRQIAGVASGLAGVVAVGSATVCWIIAQRRNKEAVTVWKKRTDDNKAKKLHDQARDFATYGNIVVTAGGALVALGTVLFLTGAPDDSSASVGPTAHVLPTVGLGFAGLSARGTW